MTIRESFYLSLVAPLLFLAQSGLAGAQDEKHPGTGDTGLRYEGAPSGIDPELAKNLVTSEGPPMTEGEFAHSKRIFFERCAGCHGVLRKGATGKPLTTDLTREKGSEISMG